MAEAYRQVAEMSSPIIQPPAMEMLKLLEELARYSAPGAGVTRLLYTSEWKKAQLFLQEKMIELGFEVYADRVGNVYGRLEGSDSENTVILTGSHIDTVVNGGQYDGAYGIAAAVTALHYLQATFGQPKRTLEVVSFCEEEGSRFPLTFWGSGNVAGLYDGSEAEECTDVEGITLEAAMIECGLGGVPDQAVRNDGPEFRSKAESDTARRRDIEAFVELHIEQGIILEKRAAQIGIVQAIVGQRRFRIKLSGTANHAGTTPMHMRKDALAGAVEMLFLLESLALEAGEPLVATSGWVEVAPNTPNVIPGEALFTLDIRHSVEEDLEFFCTRMLSLFKEIADRRGLILESALKLSTPPAPLNIRLAEALETICERQGKRYLNMVSGAGHDAQLFAPQCPTAMIFVPSQSGISHSPEEHTSPEELTAGLNVLAALLYELAY